jgi:tetratricopeptide (TPR) repeat protein
VVRGSALADGAADAGAALHSLERKGFVRRQRRSSLEGESEFAFAHALVRDVAYGQIARAERAEKHRRVAEWIEALGRPEDHAEMVAYHYGAALELAQATGGETDELVGRTRHALRSAGDRAFSLNAFPAAADHYDQALALSLQDGGERSTLLFRRAHALYMADDARSVEALGEARDALLEAGDPGGAGEAEALLARAFWYRGQHEDAKAHLTAAREFVAAADPAVGKARVLATSARFLNLAGDGEESLRVGGEALAMAEALSLDELRAHSLISIAGARGILGDPAGEEQDLLRALEIALAVTSPEAAVALNNLAVEAFFRGDVQREHDLLLESQGVGERLGDQRIVRFVRGNLVFTRWALGQWDEALAGAEAFIAECESGSPHYMEHRVRTERADINLARGHVDEALEDYRRALGAARSSPEPQILGSIIGLACRALMLLDRAEDARPLAQEFLSLLEEQPERSKIAVTMIADFAEGLGIEDEVRKLMADARDTPWKDAALASVEGDFARAADAYRSMHFVAREAEVRLLAAERLLRAGRRAEGEAEAQKALVFFRSVGAAFFVDRAERLLSGPLSSYG